MRSLMLATLLCTAVVACGDDAKSADGAGDADAGRDAAAAVGGDPCKSTDTVIGVPTKITLNDADGVERSYLLFVPKDLDLTKPAALVLNYHGLTSAASEQVAFSNLNKVATSEGFITAYPEGISKSFNAGSCCGMVANPPNDTDDGAFARVIVADIESRVCVNKRRVYSTGMSNGAYMSEYNACVNADLFAAVAPVSGMAFKQPKCEPSRPIPMIAFNGTTDTLVNYDSAGKSIADWRERNGCKGEPTRTDFGKSYCDSWTDCSEGVELVQCTATGMGHCWPGQTFCPYGATNTEIDASAELWKFLSRFELPE